MKQIFTSNKKNIQSENTDELTSSKVDESIIILHKTVYKISKPKDDLSDCDGPDQEGMP